MNLDKLLPEVSYTTTELNLIAEAMTNPVVVKYLKDQQAKCLKALGNGLPIAGQSDAEYLRLQAQLVGGMSLLEKLLSFESPSTAS